jgi:hypothetical protein
MKGIIIQVVLGCCLTVSFASWLNNRDYEQYVEQELEIQRRCLNAAEKSNDPIPAYGVCAAIMPAYQVRLAKPAMDHIAASFLSEDIANKILGLYAERVYRDIP